MRVGKLKLWQLCLMPRMDVIPAKALRNPQVFIFASPLCGRGRRVVFTRRV